MKWWSWWAGYVARIAGARDACSMLIAKLLAKNPHGRPTRRWEETLG
jgi:septal ring-binding cell division protein DamX